MLSSANKSVAAIRSTHPVSLTLSSDDIARNPAWHLYDMDIKRGELHFLEVTPETFERSAFLDTRIGFTGDRLHGFPAEAVAAALAHARAGARPATVNYLFHSSFCCSSLLARSLHRAGRTLVLREPLILRRLADLKREPGMAADFWPRQGQALLDMSLTLLAKTWTDSESVLIKPTNLANSLAAELLAARPTARALFLYSDLETFLISNLKKPDVTKQKMPLLARIFSRETGYAGLFPELQLDQLDHLQSVVIVWHTQLLLFGRLLQTYLQRLASLDSAALLAEPETMLTAAARFFGEALTAREVRDIVAGPVWHTHAKDPRATYDRQLREQESRELARRYCDELAGALRWAEPLLQRYPVSLPLPRAL